MPKKSLCCGAAGSAGEGHSRFSEAKHYNAVRVHDCNQRQDLKVTTPGNLRSVRSVWLRSQATLGPNSSTWSHHIGLIDDAGNRRLNNMIESQVTYPSSKCIVRDTSLPA